jgi:transposase
VTDLLQIVSRLEQSGGTLILDGDRIRYSVPSEDAEARALLLELRKHRERVRTFLQARAIIPAMPPGVRLVRWEPKPAPVVLTQYSVVTDVTRFVSMTILELRAAIAGKRWQAGHRSVRELIDRLEQCGVIVQVSDVEVGR